MNKIQKGLLPLEEDKRDYSLGAIFGAPKLEEIPDEFDIGLPRVKNQFNTDLCTAFAVTSASELQEHQELSPEWQFAKIRQLIGNSRGWGADLRSAMKSVVKYGSIKKSDAPFSLENQVREFVANHENWPEELDKNAQEHRKEAYFTVDGYNSHFDAIRAALWQNMASRRAVVTGCKWRQSWIDAQAGKINEWMKGEGTPHAFIFVGTKKFKGEIHLIAHLSNGTEIGDVGRFYFPKGVIDGIIPNELKKYGCYMLTDLPEWETRDNIIKKSIRFRNRWFKKIVSFIINLFK